MKAVLHHKHRVCVACPNCGEGRNRIDHLFGMTMPCDVGPWSCDECGAYFRVSVRSPDDVSVEIDRSERSKTPCWDVLVLMPQREPVFMIVSGNDYREKLSDPAYGGNEYFYNEHTCPTNWMRSVKMIIHDGDTDPHGLFRYLRSMPRGQEEERDAESIIPEAFGATASEDDHKAQDRTWLGRLGIVRQ